MDDSIKAFFSAAFGDFLESEARNIIGTAHEQNLCARLGIYLEARKAEFGFGRYRVDTECDRMLFDKVKKIFVNGRSDNIRTDLLVHVQGSADNLIALEMKKVDRSAKGRELRENDRQRLMAMTLSSDVAGHPQHVSGYVLGLFVELDPRKHTYIVEEFRAGESRGESAGTF